MNKAEFVDLLKQKDLETVKKLSKKELKEFVEFLFNTIAEEVAKGNTIAIAGFGKFYQFISSTTDKKSPKFKAFKEFKERVF